MRVTDALAGAWRSFRTRGRTIALASATLAIIVLGLLFAAVHPRPTCGDGPVELACPAAPVGPDGQPVSDDFFFAHRPLGRYGSITVRLASMTGIITYPPPGHDEIVPGLVPWAKAGIMIKDGVTQGSSYAALMLTGRHGVRMQYDYAHDVAGSPGREPRWLRLTRAGDTVTGYESPDGKRWTKVGAARLPGLPATVRAGLFSTSPGDLSFTPTALGGSLPASRFTQVTASFDHVSLAGAPAAGWRATPVGRTAGTDWERYHRAPGLVRAGGTFTVTGSGDIGPIADSGRTVASTLVGLTAALVIVIVLAARFAHPGGPALAARAAVIGAAAFVAGLAGAGVVVPVGSALLRAKGVDVLPVSALTGLRVVAGTAAILAGAAVFTLALRALIRRAWVAVLVAVAAVVLPYLLGGLALIPDAVAAWSLRLTPAAAFAVLQTSAEYPQVITHYAPSNGYFPLPGWAGFGVLCGYAAALLGLALVRARRPAGPAAPATRWR
ncbi:hypothetical protein [Nonomuraea sp. SBT364]|uniref:hypothetical protein n=1 Tax=Nonomuraea sp. SBT364 TaxID=1580530 RepID=UPI00066D9A23|nr:hypothetical protein [Nonomuraea sp. SBT364]